ncbi:MAG: hypothetical protein PF508_16220 [Spirochaeta sp.]|jgi:hypothetical protein|nr:hypothetical protein [Spirochaeta sp.]
MRNNRTGTVSVVRGLRTVVAIVAVVALAGCDIGNGSGAQADGTVTVEVRNVPLSPSGYILTAAAYPSGAPGPPSIDEIHALSVFTGVDNTLSVTLEVYDVDLGGPTGELWVGESGWGRYDLYVVIEEADGAQDQLFNAAGDRANDHPGRVLIDGDQTVVFDYVADLQEFQP